MCGSMVHIQSPTADIRRGKEKEITGQKYNGLPYYIGRPYNSRNKKGDYLSAH